MLGDTSNAFGGVDAVAGTFLPEDADRSLITKY